MVAHAKIADNLRSPTVEGTNLLPGETRTITWKTAAVWGRGMVAPGPWMRVDHERLTSLWDGRYGFAPMSVRGFFMQHGQKEGFAILCAIAGWLYSVLVGTLPFCDNFLPLPGGLTKETTLARYRCTRSSSGPAAPWDSPSIAKDEARYAHLFY